MDLLRTPVLGAFLRWRHARTSVQLVFLLVAIVLILHGLVGPDLGSTNLATVLTWVHYRGFLVIALLAAGNFFCAGCPFIRVRDWGRRLHVPVRAWPVWLRGKWIALLLFAAVLFTYELFDLWSLPRATAFIVIAYFAGALVVDLIFKGATFCKHLCPVGQFNFLASTVSPLELRVRSESVCGGCQTADCVAGRQVTPSAPAVAQRGCELGLFLPAKVGNLDCTFCLDCVQACPHDNIALATRVPALELADPARRSGIGRIVDRTDIVALVILFVFGAMVNAFVMTAPVHPLLERTSRLLGGAPPWVVLALLFIVALIVVPAIVLGASALATRALAEDDALPGTIIRRFVYGLVPFGFGVWLAHYSFHLLTGILVVVPVAQRAAIDAFGGPVFGDPLWRWTGLRAGLVFPLQTGFVLLGAFGSLSVIQAIAHRHLPARSGRAAAPWIVLVIGLTVLAIWVLFQPMEMRGMGPS
jgi:hypothetical protein